MSAILDAQRRMRYAQRRLLAITLDSIANELRRWERAANDGNGDDPAIAIASHERLISEINYARKDSVACRSRTEKMKLIAFLNELCRIVGSTGTPQFLADNLNDPTAATRFVKQAFHDGYKQFVQARPGRISFIAMRIADLQVDEAEKNHAKAGEIMRQIG